jgi:hypothetical protein
MILTGSDNALISVTQIKDIGVLIFPESGGLRRFIYHNKMGFFDGKKDSVVIKAKYDVAADFSEGYAAVKYGSHIFFINPNDQPFLQKELDTLQATEAHSFKDGYAVIRVGNRGMFYLPNRNRSILKVFEYCSDFYKGIALVKSSKRDDSSKGEKPYYFIDTFGHPLFNRSFQEANQFNQSDVAVVSEDLIRNGFSLLLRNGTVSEKTRFKKIGHFSDGLAPVCPFGNSIDDGIAMLRLKMDESFAEINGKVDGPEPDFDYTEFIDTGGAVKFKPDSAFIWNSYFNHERVILQLRSRKYVLLNTNNLHILDGQFDNIELITDGYYVATSAGAKNYYYINENDFAIPLKSTSQ